MSDQCEDPCPPEFTETIKSRILDRVLRELADETLPSDQWSGYTRSDSGLYGKYTKQDLDANRMLQIIQAEIERAVAEAKIGDSQGPPDSEE